MRTRFNPLLLALILLAQSAGLAQNWGSLTGPFLKINDLWLVYTRPAMTVEDGQVWVPARYLAAVAGMIFRIAPASGRAQLEFSGRSLEFSAGSVAFSLDGQTGAFHQALPVRAGRVMIPLEVVARAFGLGFRRDEARNIAFVTGQGLATQLKGSGPSARFALVESRRGIDLRVQEVSDLVPTSFRWRWKYGFYPAPYTNVPRVNFKTGSGFRLTWKTTGPVPQRTFVVMGLGRDDAANTLGYTVSGYGQFGFPYAGNKDPNDREYCRRAGSSSLTCDVGPVLYSEPDRYPTEPRSVVGIPRFVFARTYTF